MCNYGALIIQYENLDGKLEQSIFRGNKISDGRMERRMDTDKDGQGSFL